MSPLFSLDSLFAALEQVAENVVGDAPDERDDFVVRSLVHFRVCSLSRISSQRCPSSFNYQGRGQAAYRRRIGPLGQFIGAVRGIEGRETHLSGKRYKNSAPAPFQSQPNGEVRHAPQGSRRSPSIG